MVICLGCGSPMSWDNDFDLEDMGYEMTGIASMWSCHNCNSTAEFCIPNSTDED